MCIRDSGAAIAQGLEAIQRDIESGALLIDPSAEDIHMFMEQELTKRIGDAGKRLHTARSRNDQMCIRDSLGIAWICAMEGILLLTAALFEARIRYQETIGKRVFTLQKYKGDLMDGFRYLKKEKGIRSIYGYMAVTNASAEGINPVSYTHLGG